MPEGPASWPVFDAEARAAVERVLVSGKVNYWSGTEGRQFETEFATFTGVSHAIFVANGTVALELALRSLKLPKGSEVVTSPFTFVATATAIVAAGLKPIFADVDPDSGNITPESVHEVLTSRTTAVLVVHLGGWPADMVGIRNLCNSEGLRLVEDCAQAHGAMIGDRHVGTFADVAAWSFCTDKVVSTGGEGGMVATNQRDLWDWMWSYKDHGKSWSTVYERDHPPGFRWLHERFGTNWRATEMQAAIGRVQYRSLPRWREQRNENANLLAGFLASIPALRIPTPSADLTHAYYRLYAHVSADSLADSWTRDRIVGEVNSESDVKISTGSAAEIYREQAFARANLVPESPLPNAHRLGSSTLAFAVHPGLKRADFEQVAATLGTVMASATRR